MSKVATLEEPASACHGEQSPKYDIQTDPECDKSQHDHPSADAKLDEDTDGEHAQFSCPVSGCGKTFSQQYELKSVSLSPPVSIVD
jgi:hypothetical protein